MRKNPRWIVLKWVGRIGIMEPIIKIVFKHEWILRLWIFVFLLSIIIYYLEEGQGNPTKESEVKKPFFDNDFIYVFSLVLFLLCWLFSCEEDRQLAFLMWRRKIIAKRARQPHCVHTWIGGNYDMISGLVTL